MIYGIVTITVARDRVNILLLFPYALSLLVYALSTRDRRQKKKKNRKIIYKCFRT